MRKQCLADHYSPIVGEVAAGDVVDLPDQLDGVPLVWSEDYWGDADPPTATGKTTKTTAKES